MWRRLSPGRSRRRFHTQQGSLSSSHQAQEGRLQSTGVTGAYGRDPGAQSARDGARARLESDGEAPLPGRWEYETPGSAERNGSRRGRSRGVLRAFGGTPWGMGSPGVVCVRARVETTTPNERDHTSESPPCKSSYSPFRVGTDGWLPPSEVKLEVQCPHSQILDC